MSCMKEDVNRYSPLPFYDEDEEEVTFECVKIFTRSHGAVLYRRKLFAEMLGSFFSVFISAGGHIIVKVAGFQGSRTIDYAIASGSLSTALSYGLGDISGGHFNPMVTLAFALRGVFAWKLVFPYILAQAVGAFLSAIVLRLIFGLKEYVGSNLPVTSSYLYEAFYVEIILTMILIMVDLLVGTKSKLLGPTAGLATGAAQTLCVLIGANISGGSMNPIRSLATAVVASINGHDLYALQVYWIYIVGPLIGTLLAVGSIVMLKQARKTEEIEHAGGEAANAGGEATA